MVHGKQGFQLEAWKFAMYISVPIIASVYFNDPNHQRYWVDYFQFLKYPANPNTNLKRQFEDMLEQTEKQKLQRQEYTQQMQKLQESADKSRQQHQEQLIEEGTAKKRGWLRWIGLGKSQE